MEPISAAGLAKYFAAGLLIAAIIALVALYFNDATKFVYINF